MKVSLSWLRAIAPDIPDDAEAVADVLAARGAPVESIDPVAEGLDDIVVARVEAVEEHPNADRLRVCRVVAEPGETPRQPVCGAPNVVAGGLYAFAPVGATLPGGMEIGEVKLRGESSRGMLCSAHELTLGPDQSGLLTLPDGLEVGARLVDALGLADRRLDVEVTANRGDLLGHVGVAREASPGGQASLALPAIPDAPTLDLDLVRGEAEAAASGATVRIDAPELCSRYLGAVIRGVEIGPSPAWLQARLRAVGARPINNVVDATNYVMLETGQPLHAFDLATLAEGTIVVRTPTAEEADFETLDGEARSLDPSMLLICDAREPVAIAGVMGGVDSEVTTTTSDVLLECALFDPASIRSTRRTLALSTDASYRFERGVDPEAMETALRRACEVIQAAAGGRVEPAVADCRPRPWSPHAITLRVGRVSSILGVPFTAERVTGLLEPLGFRCERMDAGEREPGAATAAEGRAYAASVGSAPSGAAGGDGTTLRVRVPGWRSYDVTREVDLIEEIARTHGYDAFPDELGAYRPGTVPDHPFFRLEDVAFPDTGEAARAWAELALEYPGFRPAPEPAQRVEEALAVALQLDSPSCAESAAGRLHTLDPDGLETVLDRLPHRASGAVTAEALIPFFEAVVAAGGASRKLLREREMPSTPGEKPWRTVPGLSEAARRARGSSE